jgi:uncharacterized membrane protein
MHMLRKQQPAITLFSMGLIGLGLLLVIYRDFAFSWQPVPDFHPGRDILAVACGLFMIALGAGLLLRSISQVAVRILFPFLIAWLCLKLPSVMVAPGIEGVWIGFGELAMLLAGGWVLFARLSGLEGSRFFRHITGARGVRFAQILFGLAVIPVGLGHLFYPAVTASLVPSWLPYRSGLGFVTGVGQIACGVALAFHVWPRVAALIETGMLALFAFLVWGPESWIASVPKLAGTPAGARFPLTAFLITWIIGASALLIANNSGAEAVDALEASREYQSSDYTPIRNL